MNKTVTVNIGGLVFHIEEQAYDKLRKYLDAIRGYFTSSDGRDEIIQDIESRIAEIFTERIGTSRQVVTDTDVDFMINAMGRPEQVAGEDEDSERHQHSNSSTNYTTEDRSYRRLYRDPDDKVVGGVCSGISHYLGIDPIWLRLLFGIALFFYGSGAGLYIILLIIIPKAKSTTEKLEMKGKPVNIESIKKTIEEEVDDLKNRFSSDSTRSNARKATGSISRFFELLGEVILTILKAFAKLIGAILMLVVLVLLIALFLTVLAMTGLIGVVEVPVYITELFLTPTQLNLSILAMILTLGIPLLMILYRIIRSLFRIKTESRTMNLISGALWSIGVMLCIYLGISVSKEYRANEQERITIPIVQPASDTLFLASMQPDGLRDDSYYDNRWVTNDAISINEGKDSVRISRVKLDVIASDDQNFALVKIVKGNGSDRRTANKNIRSVTYEIAQVDSELKLSEYFLLDRNHQYRNQQVQLILKVPVGKSVYLSNDMEDIINDIQNVTDTYDGDMVGHTWTMTVKGLECINCNLPENDRKENNKLKVRINGEDINVDDISDSVNWDNKDVHINIDNKGVVIDAKEKDKKAKDKNWK